MITAVQGFVQRHRRGLVITAGITGGMYMMGKYAKQKLMEYQQHSSQERASKENMKRRFEQNQQDCVFTVLSLLPTLGDQLLDELNVELITATLQQSRSQRATPLPTPDSSMILPPKETIDQQQGEQQQQEVIATEHQPNGVHSHAEEENKEEKTEETVQAYDTTPAQENGSVTDQATEEDTTNKEGDTAKEDSEGTAADKEEQHTFSYADAVKTAAIEKEEGDGVLVEAPEIKIVEAEETPSAAATVAAGLEAKLQESVQSLSESTGSLAMDRRTKMELWNELKLMSFTRTITALYSLTFLTLLTHVQLNLLGRFTYVSSVVALSNTTDSAIRLESATRGSTSATNGQLSFQTEKKYLTFSFWLLHEGWRQWTDRVRTVVEQVVGPVSLKRQINSGDFSALLADIRAQLEYEEVDGEQVPVNMRQYMLPDEAADEREVLRQGGVDEFDLVVDPVLRSLLDETRDFIDSPDFSIVLNASLSSTFGRFHQSLQSTFNPFMSQRLVAAREDNEETPQAMIAEIEDEQDVDRSVPLATLLPLISRQVHLIINGVPNEYVESLAMVRELQGFSAIVYSSFSEQLTQ